MCDFLIFFSSLKQNWLWLGYVGRTSLVCI